MTSIACRHCHAKFVRPEYHALHLGRQHREILDDAERIHVEAALADEARQLAELRRHGRAILTVVPATIMMAALIVLMLVAGVNPGFAFISLPPVLFMVGVMYYMGYSAGD